jgi:hypothetical protein
VVSRARLSPTGAHGAGFVEQVEAGEATSLDGGFTCIKVGEWDDSTAARLVEQNVRVSLHTMHFAPSLHTMAYSLTLLPHMCRDQSCKLIRPISKAMNWASKRSRTRTLASVLDAATPFHKLHLRE